MENRNWNGYIYSSVHCSPVHNSQDRETPKCPPTEEPIKKAQHMCAMEFYSATTKNGIMPFAATWADLEMITLGEVSQTQKDQHNMLSLKCGN